jgi:hypothetical protein
MGKTKLAYGISDAETSWEKGHLNSEEEKGK